MQPFGGSRSRIADLSAANLSASGLKRQDNDLIVIESAVAAAAFKHACDVHMTPARLWRLARSDNDPLADFEHEVLVKLGELCA
jgi:hypothetical protein